MNNDNSNRMTIRLSNNNFKRLKEYKDYTLNSYNSIINIIIFEYFKNLK